ncbi:hypothetical protein J1G43_13800 [Cellulomonas sp. zg-ZUI22]|uniref:hypothetical protein n=1 Tax=Cellulomonas sp. zg-ZUI22 TaxID=2816955 RepID=UPI001A941554|nr:hypothetical protein [Cellulomonas sp. zg-ZUI22]MBO0901037.1 hypothetical protein [Cellulomonas sp. zg-ZUI22]
MTRLLPRRRTRRVAVPLLAAALLAGCSTDGTDAPPTAAPTAAPTTLSEPTASATAAPPADAAPQVPAGDEGPEDSFLTWLAASRAPDVATACAYMTPELAQRMVDEVTATGFPGITDCEGLIEMTAGLYAAVGQSSEATVELVEQTPEHAVLDVVYAEGSSCGRVVLRPGPGHWVLDERSQEEC